MKGTMLVYAPGNNTPGITELTKTPELEQLQKIVGGWIELVPYFQTIEHGGKLRNCRVLCNEEGKLARPEPLPVNELATELWWKALARAGGRNPARPIAFAGDRDVLVGNIIVLFGDDEFMEDL
jgi:hypothetical protein